jgi:hypothetical protein
MLSYIFRLVRDFEQEHGIHPNLLYLNESHAAQLKTSFSETFSFDRIRETLNMELIVNNEITHPHVAWTQSAMRMVV